MSAKCAKSKFDPTENETGSNKAYQTKIQI